VDRSDSFDQALFRAEIIRLDAEEIRDSSQEIVARSRALRRRAEEARALRVHAPVTHLSR
jgi:hypothetical protein